MHISVPNYAVSCFSNPKFCIMPACLLFAGLRERDSVTPSVQRVQVAQGLGAAATAQPRLRVTLHGTPRQWDDPLRPWLAVEKNRSLATLRAAGVSVQARQYPTYPRACCA